MARKVFISFLGYSNYGQCTYVKDDFKSSQLRYIQEATLDYLTMKETWSSNDVIMILLTKGAKEANWEDNGQKDKDKNPILQEGLKKQLEKKNYPMIIEPICDLPDGNNNSEIWTIFRRVFEKLNEGDELYFDLTHGFRYLPMLTLTLGNYSKFLKNTTVKHVSYGNFEGRNRTTNEAPIIDLMPFIQLQDYTDIASSLTTFGRIKNLSKALKDDNEENIFINKICNAIENFDDDLACNRMNSIKSGKNIIEIKNNIKKVRQLYANSPVVSILNKLLDELKDFEPKESNKNVEAAIEWSIKYKMLPQAYTLFQEYVILRLSEIFNEKNPYAQERLSNTVKRKNFKMYLGALCGMSSEDIEANNFKNDSEKYINTTKEILDNPLVKQIREYYISISANRNSINHAKGDCAYDELVNEFYRNYRPCLELLCE